MAVFRYEGIDKKGKKVTGVIDAENERAARSKLRRQNVYPTVVKADGAGGAGGGDSKFGGFFSRIKPRDISIMTRQLAALLRAGMPLVEALEALGEQMEQPKLKAALTSVRERVTEGERMSHAMKRFPKIFNDLYVNMVDAGEASGMLEEVLARLADITESQAQLENKVKGALTYPMVMGGVGGLIMILLVTFVMPNMTAMLIDMEVTLPWTTQLLIDITDFMTAWWWLIFSGIGVTIYAVRKWMHSPKGKVQVDDWVLRLPKVGRLIRISTVARLSRTLGTLLGSGVAMLTAMNIVRNIVANSTLRGVLEETREAVKEGDSLSEPLKRSGQFPGLAIHMIAVGEKTGELESMLTRVADTYEEEVEDAVSGLVGLLNPLILVCMAVGVLFMVVSVASPMLQAAQQL